MQTKSRVYWPESPLKSSEMVSQYGLYPEYVACTFRIETLFWNTSQKVGSWSAFRSLSCALGWSHRVEFGNLGRWLLGFHPVGLSLSGGQWVRCASGSHWGKWHWVTAAGVANSNQESVLHCYSRALVAQETQGV